MQKRQGSVKLRARRCLGSCPPRHPKTGRKGGYLCLRKPYQRDEAVSTTAAHQQVGYRIECIILQSRLVSA